jgi:WD40 repeat protein
LCARFSHDNSRVITGSDDTTARIWDANTGQPTGVVLAGHTAAVTSAVFTPDGLRVLTGSKDITAKLCDPASGKEILTLTGHTEEITSVAASPDGQSLLTGSRDGTAIVWLTVPWREQAPVAFLQQRTPR